jgi:hypothetical protein
VLPGAKLWLTVKGFGKDIALGIVVGVGGGACAMTGVGVGGKGGGWSSERRYPFGKGGAASSSLSSSLLAHLLYPINL